MGKHKYTVRVNISRGSGKPLAAFESFALVSSAYDDYEQFCQAVASKLLDKVEDDSFYLDEVQGL